MIVYLENLKNIKKLHIYKTNGSMLHLDTSLFPSTGWLNREVAAFPLCLAAASQSRALKGIISVSFTSPQSFLGYKMIVQRNAQFCSSLMHVALNINESTQ